METDKIAYIAKNIGASDLIKSEVSSKV